MKFAKEKMENNSDIIPHLPDETLLEILVKLPFKSVFRFKCVSKNWLSLVSDASFFPSLVSRSKDSPPFTLIFQSNSYIGLHGFLSDGNVFKNCHSSYPCDQIPGLKVEATSNDLILYRSKGYESVYFVANIFTRQCVRIPLYSRRKSCGYTGLISSVCDKITRYNIVRLVEDGEPFMNLEVFSSEKGEWKDLKVRNSDCFDVEFDVRPCFVLKDVVHWICNKMTTLFAYDPSSDQCRLISVPNEVCCMNGMNVVLGVSSDDLYYFEMSGISTQGCKLPGWKMWVLKDYKRGEWSLEHLGKERKIDTFGVLCNVLSTYSPLFPLAIHPWNKHIVYFGHEGYVLTFNIKKGCFEDNFSSFHSWSMVSPCEIFSLLMPLCSSRIPESQWDEHIEDLKDYTG